MTRYGCTNMRRDAGCEEEETIMHTNLLSATGTGSRGAEWLTCLIVSDVRIVSRRVAGVLFQVAHRLPVCSRYGYAWGIVGHDEGDENEDVI